MTFLLKRTIELECSRSQAFLIFTEHTDLWWPRTHRKNEKSTLMLEPHAGGRLYERAPDGSEWTIGEATKCEPPNIIEFTWFPGSSNAPTNVAVRFEGDGAQSRILIEHSAMTDVAQDIWPQRVALFDKGWSIILPAFKAQCESDLA